MQDPAFRLLTRVLRLAPALPAVLLAVPASAQPVSDAKEGGGWIGLVVAIILTIAVAVVSFMSPKRGHQD